MSEKTKKLIYSVYGIVQSLLLAVCGGCLIAACLTVYDGGDGTFSREAVTAQFQKILIPVILCLAGVIVGAVLTLILPREPKKLRVALDPATQCKKLAAKIDLMVCPSELISAMKKEQTLRLILRLMASAVCVVVAVPACIYLFDLSHFDDIGAGLTADIIAAIKVVLPAAAVGLSAWIVVTLACHFSLQRELTAVKEAVKLAPLQDKKGLLLHDDGNEAFKIWIIRGTVLLLAVVLIVAGILNGGMNDVLQKAIRICTECIGLG